MRRHLIGCHLLSETARINFTHKIIKIDRDILSQESRYKYHNFTRQQSILNEYHHIVLYKGKAESNSIMVWCASANPLVDYSLHFPSRCKLSGGLSDSCKFRGYSGRGPLAALSLSLFSVTITIVWPQAARGVRPTSIGCSDGKLVTSFRRSIAGKFGHVNFTI